MKHIYIFLFFLLTATNLFSQIGINDSVWVERYYGKRSSIFECGVYFETSLISQNFNEFQSVLNFYNTDILNQSNQPLLWGISGSLNHYTLGVQFGSRNQEEYNHDSLKIKLNTTIYGINLGYNLIDNKRWIISPLVSLKWYRYRLLNSQKSDEILLTDYLQNRDLDIRINQAICITGINIAYKSYKYMFMPCDFWTFGLQGGYPFKLHDKPIIFSNQNRLTSDYKINYGKFYFSFYFSLNLQIF